MNNNEVKAEDIGNIVPMRDLVVEQKNFAKKDQLDDKKKGKKEKKRKNKSGVNKTFDDKDLQIQELQEKLANLKKEGNSLDEEKFNLPVKLTHNESYDPIRQFGSNAQNNSFARFMEKQSAESNVSRPISRQTVNSAFKQIGKPDATKSNPDFNPGGSNSFFTILTGQQDHKDLVDQKQDLDEFEDKLKEKEQTLKK